MEQKNNLALYSDEAFADYIFNYLNKFESNEEKYIEIHLMTTFDNFEGYPYYIVQKRQMTYPIAKGFYKYEDAQKYLEEHEDLTEYIAQKFGLNDDEI